MNKITPVAIPALCVSSAPAWAITITLPPPPPNYGVVSVAATATYDPTNGLSFNNLQYNINPKTTVNVNDNAGATASAMTDYGANHAYASYANTDTASSVGALAASLWFDQITINGGTGTGTATLNASLNGTADVGAPDGAAAYVLGTSTINPVTIASGLSSPSLPLTVSASALTPVASYIVGTQGAASACLLQFGTSCPTFNQVLGTGAGQTIQANLTGSFTFTYGQSFYLIGLLGTGVMNNGSSISPATTTFDFSHTGLLNQIVLPQGASLSDASGASYNIAAVPEPAEWLTLVAGLGLVGWANRRRA